MDAVFGIVLLVGFSYGVWRLASGPLPRFGDWLRRLNQERRSRRVRQRLESEPEFDEAGGFNTEQETARRRMVEIANGLAGQFEYGVEPDTLDEQPSFREGIRLLETTMSVEQISRIAKDRHEVVACIALAALTHRSQPPPDPFLEWAVRALRWAPSGRETYLFRMLTVHAHRPVIGSAMVLLNEGINQENLARFIGDRRAAGEEFSVEMLSKFFPIRMADDFEALVDRHEDEMGPDAREIFNAWRATTVDTAFLDGVGKIWARPYDSPPALIAGRRAEVVEQIVEALGQERPRSVLLVGEHGVGKTALARAALEQLDADTIVFEASAAQINAGAMYIGELEGRIKEIVDRVQGHSVVWHLPNLEETLYAGQHSRSNQGMLDALLPAIESGELRVLAEITPARLELLMSERPRVASAFLGLQLRPLEEEDAIQVARHLLDHNGLGVSADSSALRSAFELAQQFLPRVASPGNLLRLVRVAAADAADQSQDELTHSSMVAALSASSGLPLVMLDPAAPLLLDDVRAFFAARVLGQTEAVDVLVERIALAKAGLTDPTRPLGVFLFVGPTGTGKTELAKALAEFMFGSPERMVRLDMSEYRTPESLERLLADTSVDPHGAPLIASVRKEPFAVVLLDEFEKAAPAIHDIFLQVFDDGRLTDQHGKPVDLRRTVIIMTSNVGSAIRARPGIGFHEGGQSFRPQAVLREVEQTFRPEFLNRIDRIIVFSPFERSQMRALLDKELAAALTRRGLRERPWAVELDESAYEFLIERGFSVTLGARPLKRALDRHLLTPLAAAIVEQATPEGDQFLLVTARADHQGVEVTFIDPDAEPDGEPEREADETVELELELRSLALAPRAGAQAARFLAEELLRLVSAVSSNGLEERKESGLRAMRHPAFWESDERFAALAEVEYLDRLDTALETTARLAERLAQHGDGGSRELQAIVAGRLYVLQQAILGLADGAPNDVYLRVRLAGEAAHVEDPGFTRLLTAMYTGWAERRGMRAEALVDETNEHLLAVSGLGCGAILQAEAGLHVLEIAREESRGERETERLNALVEVVPWLAGPPGDTTERLQRARRELEAAGSNPQVVRRYRFKPDPLVRDAVRGYRTGRIEGVLRGDFDLF